MTKIGIITFHHAKFSYGAILQALATETVCRNYSDSVEIINYENRYEQKGAKTGNSSMVSKIKKYINYFVREYIYQGYKNRYKKTSNIDSIYHKVSILYTDLSQLQDVDYDILISGSDQIWNPTITNVIDRAFLLDFGHPAKRISYASSMGSHILDDEEKQVFKQCLSNYNALSVREEHARQQLTSLYDGDIEVVVDPTLLLTKDEWVKILDIHNNERPEHYILTFFVTNGINSYWNEIENYVGSIKLPVWNIQSHTHKNKYVDKVIFAPTVSDFVRLISEADYVITNSFHATVFSIIFQRKFIPVLAKNNPARVINLLKMCGLEDRIGMPETDLKKSMDYQYVEKIIEEKRMESLNWLEKAIME